MTAFFTSDELAAQLQVADVDVGAATLFANLASDVVRDELRQLVDAVAGETITVYGDGGELLVLPEKPVTAVTSVVLGGLTLTLFDWRPNGALRRVIYPGSPFAGEQTMAWPFGVPVVITYSHGYVTVPNGIKAVALELAAGAYVNPEIVESYTIGDVSARYSRGAEGARQAMQMTTEQRTRLDRYRALDI